MRCQWLDVWGWANLSVWRDELRVDATGCGSACANRGGGALACGVRPKWSLPSLVRPPIMRSVMGYHRESVAVAAAPVAPTGEQPWQAPAHLVLLVAFRRAPQRSVIDCLAQRGLRTIWIDGLQSLDSVADQVVPDAIVYDAQADVAPLPLALWQLRRRFSGPLLVIDGSTEEVDEIMALELGADAHMAHPITPRRLRARLEALLRRHGGAATLQADGPGDAAPDLPSGWRLDPVHNQLLRGEQQVALTGGQAHLLRCLAQHAGRVVPRAELHEQVCAPDSELRARSVDVYVHRLRQRLNAAGVRDLTIEAVRGRGFVLRGAASDSAVAPRARRDGVAAYLNS
jgi:DNA-binding response OmpR family regulator